MIEIKVIIEYDGNELVIQQHERDTDISPEETMMATFIKQGLKVSQELFRKTTQCSSIEAEGDSARTLARLHDEKKKKKDNG